MAIARYDYGATLDPWYRRKALTGIAPDIKQTYAMQAALNEDTRQREEMGARLGLQQQQVDLARDELKFSKRQANISNLFGGVAFAKNMQGAYNYGKKVFAPSPGEPLAPDIGTLAKPGAFTGSLTTGTSLAPASTFSLGGPAAASPGMAFYPGTTVQAGFNEVPSSLSASLAPEFGGGAAAGAPAGAAGGGAAAGGTLAPPLAPGSAAQPLASSAATSPFAFAEGSLASSVGGGIPGIGLTMGAGVAGSMGGRSLGNAIARWTGLHEKTVGDIGSAVGTFAAVTAATGNPILGLAAGAVDAIFSMF